MFIHLQMDEHCYVDISIDKNLEPYDNVIYSATPYTECECVAVDTAECECVAVDTTECECVAVDTTECECVVDTTECECVVDTSASSLALKRLERLDFMLVYGSLILVSILFIVVSVTGSKTTWFQSLVKTGLNIWMVRVLWVVAFLISYIGLFLLWEYVSPDDKSRDLVVGIFFLISVFIAVAWESIFYYGQNIGLSLWLVGIMFVYNFWLFIYIWYIKPIAAIFLIPILLMYIYLMYSTARLAALNNVIL